MKLIVGLGNPGRKYEQTRHNVGFRIAERLAELAGAAFDRRKFEAEYAEGRIPERHAGPASGDGKLMLLKPQAFMNLSGAAVRDFCGYFKVAREDLLVVADDVNLPLGQLRLRRDGSAGGHNGLRDIEAQLGAQDYARLRVGVGGRESGAERLVEDLAGHVLGRFEAHEKELVEEAIERSVEACLTWAGHGVSEAMNRFNRPSKAPSKDSDETKPKA